MGGKGHAGSAIMYEAVLVFGSPIIEAVKSVQGVEQSIVTSGPASKVAQASWALTLVMPKIKTNKTNNLWEE
ncbi:hypothetical protein JK629_06625 [Aequorivita iocasae]|uniref:Uncharacterized protein n=2 Tax=Aequorivita TaxID=153265 RepID=A0ABX7DUW4_9FLAO|nr:hypothetical protein [Aequorivita iocasae]QQX77930.1 hypothetical protein JK629_06625 [Aequorivita iocasae]